MLAFLLAALLPLTVLHAQTHMNDLPVRVQWDGNYGYCGETSLIIAGLYYGQYMSQYDVRALLTHSGSQFDQLLLGINDKKAADLVHLGSETYETRVSSDDYLTWIKKNIRKGYPVLIGLYINQLTMYNDPNPDDGDPNYDHIVPAVGFTTHHDLDDPTYYADDILHYTDDGLWSGSEDHRFSAPFGPLQLTRVEANQIYAPIYSLAKCESDHNCIDYAIAIKGVKDLHGDTLPVRITANPDRESPPIADGSQERPPAHPIVLTITVSDLEPGTPYNLYKYTRLDAVPESYFNANAASASSKWEIQIDSGSTYTFDEVIQSSDMAFYRAVKASAN